MIAKFTLLISIIFSTLGLNGASVKVDSTAVQQVAGTSQTALASPNSIILPDLQIKPKILKNAPESPIYAQNYLLADDENGLTFLQKNSDVRVPIASTTKIMTATIVLENYNLSDVVTMSKDAVAETGASLDFFIGEKFTVSELLYCMLIKSENGAAYALAEHANTGSETGVTKFIGMMNEKAKSLGMDDTLYQDPAGLNDAGYSTAYDLLLATKYALKIPLFAQIVDTPTYTAHSIDGKYSIDLPNSNRLVNTWNYPGAIGVKTGFTDGAGHCLVGAARRNGHTLIAIALHTNSIAPDASATEVKKLLDWGFSSIDWGDNSNNVVNNPQQNSSGSISTGASDL